MHKAKSNITERRNREAYNYDWRFQNINPKYDSIIATEKQ